MLSGKLACAVVLLLGLAVEMCLGKELDEIQAMHVEEKAFSILTSEMKWMMMPGGDGSVRMAVLGGLDPESTASEEDVTFLLWTRENWLLAEQLSMNDEKTQHLQYFNRTRPTMVLVHGFGDCPKDSLMFPTLKEALLAKGDYNIIAVDWSKLAQAPWYRLAAKNTAIAGKQTAAMIDFLVQEYKAPIHAFHLIGFSLGAHVVGLAAKTVTAGKIERITGLDPAQVLFRSLPPEEKLHRDDAKLVEVIHTSGGYLAFIESMGHRDFFPNGGYWPQPGCSLDFVGVCSHQRAFQYLAEAIVQNGSHMATRCNSWELYKSGLCDGNEEVPVWNDNWSMTGNFFLETNGEKPYAKV